MRQPWKQTDAAVEAAATIYWGQMGEFPAEAGGGDEKGKKVQFDSLSLSSLSFLFFWNAIP